MRHLFLFNILLLFSSILAKAQNPTVISYGQTSATLIGEKGLIDANGNSLMIGRINESANDYPLVTCFDANHVQKFSFSLNVTGHNASVLKDAGNGEFVATFSSGVSAILLKFNISGTVLWVKKFNNLSELESILIDNSGNIYVAGGYLQHVHLVKLQSNGSITWVKRYNFGSNYVFGRGLEMSHDNQIMLMASATYMSGTTNRISLLKISPNGSTTWKKTYWTNIGIVGTGMARSPKTNRYLIAGYKGNLSNVNTLDAYTMLIDSAGNYINSLVLGFSWWDQHYAVTALPEGGYVTSGLSKPVEICGGNGMFVKYNDMNDTILTRTYGASSGLGAIFQDVKHSSAMGIVAFGAGSTFGYWNSGSEFINLRFNGNLDLNCHKYHQVLNKSNLMIFEDTATLTESTTTFSTTDNISIVSRSFKAADVCAQSPLSLQNEDYTLEATIYPNPCMGYCVVKVPDNALKQLQVCDLNGKTVLDVIGNNSSTQKIELGSLATGVYYMRIKAQNGHIGVKKLVVE